MDEIKVGVVRYDNKRKNLMLRYVDPLTGKQKHKSAGTHVKREAERAAAKWEAELREGRYCGARITWADFREKYDAEVLSGLAEGTRAKVDVLFNTLEKHVNPQRLRDLTESRLSAFQAKLREEKLAETTISSMLAHLRSALNWAVQMRLLAALPRINKPKRVKGGKTMKGRPIAGEEFDRMLAVVPKVVGDNPATVEAWKHYLRGLWWSGLRLVESLELSWDEGKGLSVDLSGKYPMLRIKAEAEKGFKDRMLAVAPEFAEILLATPEAERAGPVFNPVSRNKRRPSEWWVSRTVSAIGQKAGIKVNTDAKGNVKYASAHDLRRSFGERWATRVMPQTLMELMRHESIETTMKFYVGRNAQSTAALLWQAVGNTFGNTPSDSGPQSEAENRKNQRVS